MERQAKTKAIEVLSQNDEEFESSLHDARKEEKDKDEQPSDNVNAENNTDQQRSKPFIVFDRYEFTYWNVFYNTNMIFYFP